MENESKFQEDHAANFIRLDSRSKISLMAAVIYAFTDFDHIEGDPKQTAVEAAFTLDRMVGDRLMNLKKEKIERIKGAA